MPNARMMACPDCDKEISRSAPSCPHCGRKVPASGSTIRKIGGYMVALAVAVGLFLALMVPDLAGCGCTVAVAVIVAGVVLFIVGSMRK